MKKEPIFFFLMSLLLFVAYSTYPAYSQTESEKAIRGFVANRGYEVVNYNGIVRSYTLEQGEAAEYPESAIWALMNVNPRDYFGKTIEVHRLLVTNHPLDHYEDSLGDSYLSIYVCESQIIGGTSFPHTQEQLYGAPYSLDGRSL